MDSSSAVTFIGFLLDETGSMSSVIEKTISGVNEYVESMKRQSGDIRFTLTRFNSDAIRTTLKAVPIADVPPLEDYRPTAVTPLYDAVGKIVRETEDAVAAITEPASVLIVIMTDGQENASREFTQPGVFDLIRRKEAHGWTFVYLAANQDAFAVGAALGVNVSNTANFAAASPDAAMRSVAESTATYLRTNNAGASYRGFFANREESTDQHKSKPPKR